MSSSEAVRAITGRGVPTPMFSCVFAVRGRENLEYMDAVDDPVQEIIENLNEAMAKPASKDESYSQFSKHIERRYFRSKGWVMRGNRLIFIARRVYKNHPDTPAWLESQYSDAKFASPDAVVYVHNFITEDNRNVVLTTRDINLDNFPVWTFDGSKFVRLFDGIVNLSRIVEIRTELKPYKAYMNEGGK